MNKWLVATTLSVLLLVPVGAQNVFADQAIFISTADSDGSSLLPDRNEGNRINFCLGTNTGSLSFRSFVTFDITSIPPGSNVNNVELKFFAGVFTSSVPIPISIHKLTTSWDEATVTWNSPWTNPGGDFVLAESASHLLPTAGFWTVNTPQLISDVQGWVDNPVSNDGWLLKRTTEPGLLSQTCIAARDSPSPNVHPMLTITFTLPQEPVIGGKIIPIETTSLLLAGAQSFSWMIPVVLSVLGIGLFVVSRKSENS